jgi:predicted transport protein
VSKKGTEPKTNYATNNYLEVLINDETTTLEQLNRLCATKHDNFFGTRIPRRKMSIEMQGLETEEAKEITMDVKAIGAVKEGSS